MPFVQLCGYLLKLDVIGVILGVLVSCLRAAAKQTSAAYGQ